MSMLQVRVPETLKRALRRRAREHDSTMTDYVLRLIRRDLEQPSPQEISRRLAQLTPHDDGPSGAELVDEARRERQEELGW